MRALGLCVALCLAGSAQAQVFCDQLAQVDVAASEQDQSFALPDYTEAEAGCRVSLNMGGARSLHCMWAFDYRAAAAKEAFGALLDQMRACAAEDSTRDPDVNHPDFYDLRLFELGPREASISLKDKGALQQTLVFLTVTTP